MDLDAGHVTRDVAFDPSTGPSFPTNSPLPTLKQATRALIGEAMKRTHNNRSMAAKLLGITRQTLARNLSDQN
jgi:transcriptional regulator with PAS, ATPase and Fis domain